MPRLDWWGDSRELEAHGLRILAAIVRTRRIGSGLSQRQLAWRASVNQSTISRVERGLRTVKMSTYARIVAILQVPPDIAFEGDPPPPTRRLPGQPRRRRRT